MENAQQRLVIAQFGPQASAYVESVVHAQGADLDHLAELLTAQPAKRALDLGCGGGHVTLRIAPLVEHVTAYDLAESMLEAVTRQARQRQITNVSAQQGAVEALPFEAASFDLVVSRYSAHHWTDFEKALREARRVLAPGGRAVFMDVIAPERPLFDTVLQTLELLRDPSHVRNYSATQWVAALNATGFTVGDNIARRLRLDFASWIARMNTASPHVAAIRSLQSTMGDEVRAYFDIEPDGSFTIDTASFEGTV